MIQDLRVVVGSNKKEERNPGFFGWKVDAEVFY